MTTEQEAKLIDALQDMILENGYEAVVRAMAGQVNAEAGIAEDVAADLGDGVTSCARALGSAAGLLRMAAGRIRASEVVEIRGIGGKDAG